MADNKKYNALAVRTNVFPRADYWDAIQKMANRMAFSEQKYGPLEENYPYPGNAVVALRERLDRYLTTGNTEWLIDVANFAIIEALFPRHDEAHFRATGSEESPGVPGVGDRA